MQELTFRATQFLLHEAELLDERRLEDWLALYAPDAWYWAPVLAEATERGLALAHFDDDRTMLEARVRRLRQANAHSEQPPTRTCRMVGGVRIAAAEEHGRLVVRSTLLVHEYRRGAAGERRRSYAALVRHGLCPQSDGFRIAWKRIDLVDGEGGFHVASVPL